MQTLAKKTKKDVLLSCLDRGIALLHLDSRQPGVVVPAQHRDDPHLRLSLSYRYAIPDLVIDDGRVQATLSFRGRPFQCQVPWDAIFCISSKVTDDASVWPEDLPSEVLSELSQVEDGEVEPQPRGRPRWSQRKLLMVSSDAPPAPQEEHAPALADIESIEKPSEPTPPRRAHLRLLH